MPNISISDVDMQKMNIEKYEDVSSGETKLRITQYYYLLDNNGERINRLGRGEAKEDMIIGDVPDSILNALGTIQSHLREKARNKENLN